MSVGDSAAKKVEDWFANLLSVVGVFFDFGRAFSAAEIDRERHLSYHAMQEVPLTPQEAAGAVVKNIPSPIDYQQDSAYAGVNRDRFGVLTELAGNPPGPMDLVTEWRRGQISTERLHHGIRQGFTKDEWLDFYENLRWLPISVSDAVTAAVQNHLPYAEAARIADGNGVAAGMFDVLYANAGNPPGPMELLQMWNRGIIDQSEATQGLRESRLKDKWIPYLLQLKRRHPPQRTVTMLLNAGAISDAQAREYLAGLGYDPTLADALIKASHKTKTATSHHLTVANIRSLYEDRVIDRPTAVADLEHLGYDAADAGQLLDLADATVIQKYRNAATGKIRSLYVAHKLDANQARADLDAIGLNAESRDHLLTLWSLERDASVRTLSLGQLNQAFKKGFIDRPAFISRVMAMGYDQADAEILSDIDVPPTAP